MPGPEGQPLPPPAPGAQSNANIPVPMAEQVKNLPVISELPGVSDIEAAAEAQSDAEDSLFARGAHNPNIAAAEARAAVENAHDVGVKYDVLLDGSSDTSHLTAEGAAVRPEGYPVISDSGDLAQREEANVAAAVRQGRVDDGKPPFVMPQ